MDELALEMGFLFIIGFALGIVKLFDMIGSACRKFERSRNAKPDSRCHLCREGYPRRKMYHIIESNSGGFTMRLCTEELRRKLARRGAKYGKSKIQ